MESWLDLSAYDLGLKLLKTKDHHYLVLHGDHVINHADVAKKLNFRPVAKRADMMIRNVTPLKDGTLQASDTPSLRTFASAFPQAREVAYDPEVHLRDNSQEVQADKTGPGSVMEGPTQFLGLNRNGQEVFQAANGRWARDDKSPPYSEVGSVAHPSSFLRAPNAEALAACAEGFVEESFRTSKDGTQRNKVLRSDDFARFYRAVREKEPVEGSAEYQEARDAVEAASARLVYRKDKTALASAYNKAAQTAERLAFLSDGRGAALRGPIGPIGLTAQRLLGSEAVLSGRRVLLHNPGLGHSYSHLPRSAELVMSGDVDPVATRLMLTASGGKVSDADPGTVRCDSQILDIGRSRSGKPAESGAGPLGRADLAQALALLDARNEDGNTVLVLDGPADDAEARDLDAFRDHVAQRYAFDGESRVVGSLWRGRPEEPSKLVLSLGWRRPQVDDKAFPPTPREVLNWGDLWSWSAEVLTSRTTIERELGETPDEVEFNANEKAKRTAFQVPYVSASRIGTPRTMVPRNLEGATREAIARVVGRHGEVDAFVADEYGYTLQELGEIFSPEQVDAMALAVDAEERGRGFLVADETGVGKGRLLAAIMRRNVIKGRNVTFLTEKQTNLSDIVRDLRHTRTLPLLKIKIVNDGVQIINEDDKSVVMRSTPREEIDAMLASEAWPTDGTNLVLGTYSQFTSELKVESEAQRALAAQNQAPDADGPDDGRDRAMKAKWLVAAVGAEDAIIVDECHNAASGTSNISRNLSVPLSKAVSRTFSSATFAHKAQHMAFYAPLLPDNMPAEELTVMLDKGGETFQEVLSGMLVHDGVMIRREHDKSNLSIETVVDMERKARNWAHQDAVAPVLNELMRLSNIVEEQVKTMNARLEAARPPRRRGQAADANAKRRGSALTRLGYGAPLYTVARLFIASLRIDKVAELAIESLRNDEKPIILVENTVETLLSEVEEPEDAEIEAPDMRVLFHKVLRQIVTVKDRTNDADGVRRDLSASIPEVGQVAERIRAMIEALPRLHLSAIDEVKRRIEETGFTCGEITGRGLEVRDGRVMRRSIPNPTTVKNDFNSGDLDAVIINNSGSTGIDLHAGSRFRDQRVRHMIELQAPADIVKAMQARGRPNRYDQVHQPKYTTVLTGLPVEMRLAAMDNAKMRRLSANTTSNRDTAALIKNIPDLINKEGDLVCSRYAEARPELMRMLGLKVSEVERRATENLEIDEQQAADLQQSISKRPRREAVRALAPPAEAAKVGDNQRTANEILSRLILLPVSLQEQVCTELVAEYLAHIEELEARGETPLKTQELAGIVHPKVGVDGRTVRTAFEGAEVENSDSVFNEPLYLMDAALERAGTALKGDDLLQLVSIGEMNSGRMRPCVDRLRTGMDEILHAYLPENVTTVAAALEAKVPKIVKRKDAMERLIATLGELKAGSQVTYTNDGVAVQGIVTKVDYPARGFEHVPGMYGVEFAIPGDERPRTMRLETLLRDKAFELGAGLAADDYDPVLKRFDDATHVKFTTIKLLTHNIYAGMRMAVEHGLGTLKTYKLKDGTLHRGIVLSKRMHDINNVPVLVRGSDMAMAAIEAGHELMGDPKATDKALSAKLTENDLVVLRLPPQASRKYGFVYDDPRIKALLHRTVPDQAGKALVTMKKSEFKDALDGFKAAGMSFSCNSIARKWANEWLSDNQPRLDDRARAPEMGM